MNCTPADNASEKHPLCALEWLAFIALFLLVGTIDHDPWWKKGEAYGFGLIYHFFTTDTWLIPMNAGVPFMEKPPLYYWTSVGFCHLFSRLLPLHDAARLASTLFTTISSVFVYKTSLILFKDRGQRRGMAGISVALMLGSYGLTRFSHALITDIALLCGTTITLYAFARLCATPQRWKRGGFWLGTGLGIAFMSKGLIMPCVLALSGILIWIALPQLHTRKTLWAALLALLVASPFLFIWPILVYQYSPALFTQWFWENNIGRFLGSSVPALGAENRPFYFLWLAPIFAFPTFPLACAEVICGRKTWRDSAYILPATVSGIGMITLLLSASGRAPYLIPLIPAFTLLATQTLMRIPERALGAWNILVRILFTFTAACTWLIWWNLLQPKSDRPFTWLVTLFDKCLPPDFVPHGGQIMEISAAVAATFFWLATFRFRKNTPQHTARIWFTGAALLWCTIYSLLLPWINETRSFRTVLTQLAVYIQQSPYAGSCIGNYNLGENVAPMLQYFTHKQIPMPMQDLDGTDCKLLLTFAAKETSPDIDPRWKMIWKGSRFLDLRSMELRLYSRLK